MTKLFLIGNGFDRSHDLKTSYEDFRTYLLSNRCIQLDELIVPEITVQQDGGETFDETEVLSLLFYLINNAEGSIEEWKNLESSLADLDYDQAFEFLPEVFDKDGDSNDFKTAYIHEDVTRGLKVAVLKIQGLFKDWIDTIDIGKATPKQNFRKLIGKSDLFITFNYTDTLEEIYDVLDLNVCHIHGRQSEKIFFGHGEIDERSKKFSHLNIGAQGIVAELHSDLRKKTEEAIKLKWHFFEALKNVNITEIYSYGFSYSTVDHIYIIKLCNLIDTSKVVWYLNDFDEDCHETYCEKIISAGFKGTFDTFKVT